MKRITIVMNTENILEEDLLEAYCPGDFIEDQPCTFVGNCPIEESNYELDSAETCRKCWEEEI